MSTMNKDDSKTTIQDLKDIVVRFRNERGWGKHHSPKNLSMSIAIEAAELMEHFQWDEYSQADKQDIADELSDILSYCFNLADTLGIDVATAYRNKMARVSKKFPTTSFNPSQDSAQEYHRIKKTYRTGKDTKHTT